MSTRISNALPLCLSSSPPKNDSNYQDCNQNNKSGIKKITHQHMYSKRVCQPNEDSKCLKTVHALKHAEEVGQDLQVAQYSISQEYAYYFSATSKLYVFCAQMYADEIPPYIFYFMGWGIIVEYHHPLHCCIDTSLFLYFWPSILVF